jgi:hypothetical protein
MNTLMVGYDLNKPGQDYEDLIGFLKDCPAYWHHLDSTWLVRTTLSTSEMRDKLKQFLDKSDELLVINVTGDAWATWGISQSGNDWLHKHMS